VGSGGAWCVIFFLFDPFCFLRGDGGSLASGGRRRRDEEGTESSWRALLVLVSTSGAEIYGARCVDSTWRGLFLRTSHSKLLPPLDD
jgi:hypothetical protein